MDPKIQQFEEIAREVVKSHSNVIQGIIEIRRRTNVSLMEARALSDYVRSTPAGAKGTTPPIKIVPELTPEQNAERAALKVCAELKPRPDQIERDVKIPRIKELRNRVPGLGLAEAKVLIERATGEVLPGLVPVEVLAPFQLDGQTLYDLETAMWNDDIAWKDISPSEQSKYVNMAEQIDALYNNRTLPSKSTFDPFNL